jgi:HEAT repeat protein
VIVSAEARNRSEVNAIPFLVTYLLYTLLFGILLYDEGAHPALWSMMTLVLSGLGVVGLKNIKEMDVPMVMGILYLVGVAIGLYFYTQSVASELISALVLSFLFLAGILGNVLYFICEKQKLDYLNGQISESGLTFRRFENWFPLWLILLGNLVLVGLITPLLWGAWYKLAGPALFKIKTTGPVTLNIWFGYLIENVNQSLLGVASLLGITLPKKAVTPTGAGKALVALFRVGILSLGLGALKRYLDLKTTTRRLMLAMGRAGWEKEKWESEVEGKRTAEDTGESFESRRQMWQLRMSQLLQLFPAQQSWVLREIAGRGDFQLRLQGKLKKQDLKIPEGHTPAFQPKHLSDWIRSQLASTLTDTKLYENAPGVRYEVLRDLCGTVSNSEAPKLPSRVRINIALTLMKIRRSNDPASMVERVEKRLIFLAELAKQQAEAAEDPWKQFNEQRAMFAALFALVKLGRSDYLVALLPSLRRHHSTLQVDAIQYIAELCEQEDAAQTGVLHAVERLLLGREEDLPGPVLDELEMCLQQLPEEAKKPYNAFAARALGYFLIPTKDEALLKKGAQVLLACGHHTAIKALWRLVRIRPEAATRRALFAVLIENNLSELTGQFLRLKLVAGAADTELLAATLLGELPPTAVSRKALREAIVDPDNADETRWRAMSSLGRLAQAGDRHFLEQLGYTQSQPRLWAANQYALYRCGDSNALETLLEQLITQAPESAVYEATREVFADEDPVQAEAICTALSSAEDNEHRLEACETLVGLRAPSALVVLGRLLQDSSNHKKIRQTAAEDLGILGRSLHSRDLGLLAAEHSPAEWAAGPLLVALENDDDRLVRIRSARALGRLGLPEIKKRFEESLLNPDENALVRQVVAQAVGEMGDTTWLAFLEQQYPIEKSAQVRQGMLTAFDRLGAEAPFFLDQLDAKNAKVKQISLQALTRRELKEKQKALLYPLLEDKHRDVRAAAATTLAAQHCEDAIIAICEHTNHEQEPEKVVRRACLKALQQLVIAESQKEQVWPYLEFVWDNDPDHLVIRDCAATMARLFREAAAPVLLKGLTAKKKREPWTKSFAGIVWALGETNAPEAKEVLFEKLQKQLNSKEVNFNRLIALIRPGGLAGGVDALPSLIELVNNNEQAYSWVACQVVAEIGHFAAIDPLTEILETKREDGTLEPNTEAAILVALVRLGVWKRLNELVSLLKNTSEEREVARRRALGMLPDIDMGLSPMMLMQTMNPRSTPHEKIRETAVKSLGNLAGRLEQVLQVLQWQAQADPRAKIREAAQEAIETVGTRLERTTRKLRRGVQFETRAKVAYKKAPLHPAWGEPPAEEETIVLKLPTTKPGEAPTSATGVTAPSTPKPTIAAEPAIKPPSAVELMMDAIVANNRKEFEKQWKKASDAPLPSLWQNVADRLIAVDNWQADHSKDWLFVPGNPTGKADFWPFMVMTRPINRREFAAFCEDTNHPLPPGWRVERQGVPDQSPLARLNWHDADAFARWKGLQLPTQQQLTLATQMPTQRPDGTSEAFTINELRVWTKSHHPRRRKLMQTFSTRPTTLQHAQKLDRADDLFVRLLKPIDCKTEPLGQLILQGAHLDLPRLFAFCAQELDLALPFDRNEWKSALKALTESAADNQDGLSPEEYLARQREVARIKAEAEQKQREEAEKRRREEAERKRREEEERKRREEAARVAQQLQSFWASIQEGKWQQALTILEAERSNFDASVRACETELRELVNWLNDNQSMIWLHEDTALKGDHRGRAVLVQSRFISRKEYHTFCKQNALPLPKGWKTTAQDVSEPNAQALGISLFDAKRYASLTGGTLPSLTQLKALQQENASLLEYEWTSSARPRTRGLYVTYAGSFERYTWYGKPETRSHQLYETPDDVGFRLCFDISKEGLPSLLQKLFPHFPKATSIATLPRELGPALQQTLKRKGNE